MTDPLELMDIVEAETSLGFKATPGEDAWKKLRNAVEAQQDRIARLEEAGKQFLNTMSYLQELGDVGHLGECQEAMEDALNESTGVDQ